MNALKLSSMRASAHHAGLHGHNQRQPQANRSRKHVAAWREDRGLPFVDTAPYVHKHSFAITTVVPEKAIPTNPATAASLHLSNFHRGYRVGPGRRIIFPTRHPRDLQLPEGALLNNADNFDGSMAPYVIGRNYLKQYDRNFGSAYLLSPCVQAPDGNSEGVYLGTAQHNIKTGLKHSVGAVIPAVLAEEYLVELTPGNAFDGWRLPAVAREVIEDLNDYPPVPQSCPATAAYPALEITSAKLPALEQGPNIAMMLLDAPDKFPFNGSQDWLPGMKQDWLVPAYVPQEELVGSFVAVAGVAGSNADLQQLKNLYGLEDDTKAEMLAQELTRKVLPAQELVISSGDIIADNGLYLYHRASANSGMSGSAVRSIKHPQLLLGTHIGACGPYSFNVATSVNHPVFCALYVECILPAIMEVTEWPAAYMPGSLSGYLQHHKKLLQETGLWDKHADPFVSRHGPSDG